MRQAELLEQEEPRAEELRVQEECHIPDFRTQYPDYNYDFTRFFHLTMTPYEYLVTIIRLTYIIRFILIPNSLSETGNP